MDSREFWKFGYYWFADKPSGDYLVRVDLLPVSIDYNFFAPSYYGDQIGWASASSFAINREETYNVDIHMQPLVPAKGGVGSIYGVLRQGDNCADGLTTQGTIVYLLDKTGFPIDYTYPEPTGAFFFDGLALGDYDLKVEMTGNYGEKSTVTLTNSSPSITNVVLHYNCNAFVGIQEDVQPSQTSVIGKIYPIPAKDHVTVDFYQDEAEAARIEIFDLNGNLVQWMEIWNEAGQTQTRIELKNVKKGLYILKFASNNGAPAAYRKLIVN
jgi:hypothetical protein